MATEAPKLKPGECYIVTDSGELKKVKAPQELKEKLLAESKEPSFKPPPRLIREKSLQKPPSAEEMESITAVFKKFDKDGSGQIDLNELQAMCGSLGKKMSDVQAVDAMQQMDKDGNMQCDFDEFLAWYTSTPGLGGYDALALKFMQARLKMEAGLHKIKKRAQGKYESANDFVFKGTVDLSPDVNGPSREAMSATFAMKKGEATNEKASATVQMSCKDADAAKATVKLFDDLFDWMKSSDAFEWCSEGNLPFSTRQEGSKVFFSREAAPEDIPGSGSVEEKLAAFSAVEDAVKKLEGKVCFGVSFQELLENGNLDKPILSLFPGAKVDADVNVSLTTLTHFLGQESEERAMVEATAKVFSLLVYDAKISYNQANLWALSKLMKKITRREKQKFFLKIAQGSLRDLRDLAYAAAVKQGFICDGEWNIEDGGDGFEAIDKVVKLLVEMGSLVTSVDSVAIGIPRSTTTLAVTFDKVNPFPLGNYLYGTFPKDPSAQRLTKPQSQKDAALLKQTFDKFDKDKSGNIDLKELKDMFIELGVKKITDKEVQSAMDQLDTSKDGKCSFDEFVAFWSSETGLGGHSSVTLKLLRAKIATSALFNKGRKWLGALVDPAPDPANQDTVFKYSAEVGPSSEEIREKMSAVLSIDVVDEQVEGLPRLMVKLSAKSPSAAAEVVKTFNESFEMAKTAMAEGMNLILEVAQVGATEQVQFKLTSSEEFLTDMTRYEECLHDKNLMRLLVPAIKALRQSNAKVVFANDFDEFLAQPDKPMPEAFKGAKGYVEVNADAKGRQAFLDMLAGSSKMTGKKSNLVQGFAALLTGAEMSSVIGYHASNILDPLRSSPLPISGMVEKATTPIGLKDTIAQYLPLRELDSVGMELDQWKSLVAGVECCLESLCSVDSIFIGNFDLPTKFSLSGTPATLGFTATFNNVKPFGFLQYLAQPALTAVKLGSFVGANGGCSSDSDSEEEE